MRCAIIQVMCYSFNLVTELAKAIPISGEKQLFVVGIIKNRWESEIKLKNRLYPR